MRRLGPPEITFYRATLCVSAVFAVARCLSVRLSVCLSRWCIVSTRLKISSNVFLGPVAPSFRSFDPERRYRIPRGTPSAGAQNTRDGKILRFSTEIAVYLRKGETGPGLLWNVNRKSQVADRSVSVPMIWSDP